MSSGEYLAIKNWDKYQSSRTGEWIKDYTAQDGDDKICKLTLFQRQVLSGIRRIHGRTRKNVPYDVPYICQAMHVLQPDRSHIRSAIAALIAREFLILTNQQDSTANIPRVEKRRVDKKREEKTSASRDPLPKDSRHSRIQAMVMNCYHEQNQAECPWDGGEGKQLKALLDSTPGWADTQIAQCLSNLYESSGFAKGTRPREWLTKLPKYLQGPLNEFNQDRKANGYVNKAQQRQESSNDAIRTALARITGKDGSFAESSLPLLGHDSGDGGNLLEGNGNSRSRSGQASLRGGDQGIAQKVPNVPLHRGNP